MSTTASKVQVDELVAEACARNIPIELHYIQANGPMIIGRARLLDFDQDHILADRPLCLDQIGTIPAGKKLSIHFALQGKRYQFESMIQETERMVRLNDRQEVRGIALQWPVTLTLSQRREFLRVSMASYDPISVEMLRPDANYPTACPVDAKIYHAWLVDLSVGGTSILLDQHILRNVKYNELFLLSFELPGCKDEFLLYGSVRHSRVIEVSESIRIAMRFQGWNSHQLKNEQRRLSRFIASHERRLLRRKK